MKTLKEKRLQILSLAMDINEKYGAVCFVRYEAHVDSIDVSLFNEPWEAGRICDKSYNAYGDDRFDGMGENISNDKMIAMLQDILENGLKNMEQ